jgi:hypothetical protein
MTTTTVHYDKALVPPATLARFAPRFFVRTLGARFHVIDAATGHAVSAFWSHAAAHADSTRRNG